MLNLCSLLLEIWFDPAWRNNEFSDPTYTAWTGNREPGRSDGEPIAVNGNIHLPQREPDGKDDGVVSFFTFSAHISHQHTPLPTMKVHHYSGSIFHFSLLSSLRSHIHFTQYLNYRKSFYPNGYISRSNFLSGLPLEIAKRSMPSWRKEIYPRCGDEGKCLLHLSPRLKRAPRRVV